MKKLILVISLLFVVFVCFSQRVDNTTQIIKLKCNVEKAYNISFNTALEFNWEIKNSVCPLNFTAETPQSMNQWSDYVNVFIISNNDSISTVTVKSKLSSKENIAYIKLYLKTIIAKSNKN